MSMPVITPGTSTKEQAVIDIITSVALEQTGLSHIINAEGEKIQKAVALSSSAAELVEVNKSVQNTLNAVSQLEMILKNKLELFQCIICEEVDNS